MRVIVDRTVCVGHGQCEVAAPEVFSVNDDGELELNENPPESERANVENAVRQCPVGALTLEP